MADTPGIQRKSFKKLRRQRAAFIQRCTQCNATWTKREVKEPYICRMCRLSTHMCVSCGDCYNKKYIRICPDCNKKVCENCECICYELYYSSGSDTLF